MSVSFVIGILLVLLLLILAISIVKKVFGVVFKIVLVLVVIIAILIGISAYDLHKKDIETNEVHLVFTQNGTVQGGFLINNTKVTDVLDSETLENISREEYSHITLLVETNTSFDDINVTTESGILQQYRNYKELYAFFKNDTVTARPKTLGFIVLEALQ